MLKHSWNLTLNEHMRTTIHHVFACACHSKTQALYTLWKIKLFNILNYGLL